MAKINGQQRMVVKKRIKEAYEQADGELRPGTPEYRDLMHNVDSQVRTVLEDCRSD